MATVKKIPVRLCLGCKEPHPKKELARIVRSPEGEISYDPGGKKPGRGAYICRKLECFDAAVKTKQFAKAFKEPVAAEKLAEARAQLFGGAQ